MIKKVETIIKKVDKINKINQVIKINPLIFR